MIDALQDMKHREAEGRLREDIKILMLSMASAKKASDAKAKKRNQSLQRIEAARVDVRAKFNELEAIRSRNAVHRKHITAERDKFQLEHDS